MPRALLSLVTILALAAPVLARPDASPQERERQDCPSCRHADGQRRERLEKRRAERVPERFERRRLERHELRQRLERRRHELGRERLRARVRALDGERRVELERRLREAQRRSHVTR